MKIVFLGTGEIGLPSLKAIYDSSDHHIISVFTQPDKPFGRKGELKPSEIKKFAQSKNIPIYQPYKIREQEAIDQLSIGNCLLYTSPSPRDRTRSRMPSSA